MDILNSTIQQPIKTVTSNLIDNCFDHSINAHSFNSISSTPSSSLSLISTPSPSSVDNSTSSNSVIGNGNLNGSFGSAIASSVGIVPNNHELGTVSAFNNQFSALSSSFQYPGTMFGQNQQHGFMNSHDFVVSPHKQQQQQQNLNDSTALNYGLMNNNNSNNSSSVIVGNIGGVVQQTSRNLQNYTLTNSNNGSPNKSYNNRNNQNNVNSNNNKKMSSSAAAVAAIGLNQQQNVNNKQQQQQAMYYGGGGGNNNSGKNILVNGIQQSPQHQIMTSNKQQQQQQNKNANIKNNSAYGNGNNNSFNSKMNLMVNQQQQQQSSKQLLNGGGVASIVGDGSNFVGNYQQSSATSSSMSPSPFLSAATGNNLNNSNNNALNYYLNQNQNSSNNENNNSQQQQQLLQQAQHVNNWLNSNSNNSQQQQQQQQNTKLVEDHLASLSMNIFRSNSISNNNNDINNSTSFGLNFVSNKSNVNVNSSSEINNNNINKYLNHHNQQQQQQNGGMIRNNINNMMTDDVKPVIGIPTPQQQQHNHVSNNSTTDFNSQHNNNANNLHPTQSQQQQSLSNSLPTSSIVDMNMFGDIWLNSSVTNELNATFGNSITSGVVGGHHNTASSSSSMTNSAAIFNGNTNDLNHHLHHHDLLANTGGATSAAGAGGGGVSHNTATAKLFDLWQPISTSTAGSNSGSNLNGFNSNLSWPDHFSGFSNLTNVDVVGTNSNMMNNSTDITNSGKATMDLFELNKKADIFLNKHDGQLNEYFNLFELFKKMFIEHTVNNDIELCQTNFDFYSRLVKSDLDRFDFSHQHRKQLATIDAEFVESMSKLDEDKSMIDIQLSEFQTYFKTLYGSTINGDHLSVPLANKIKQLPFFNNLYSAKYNHQFLNLAQFYKKIIDTIPRELLIHLPIIAELSNRFAETSYETTTTTPTSITTTTAAASSSSMSSSSFDTNSENNSNISNNEPLFTAYRNLIVELDKLKQKATNNINNKQHQHQSADAMRNNDNSREQQHNNFDNNVNHQHQIIDKENKDPKNLSSTGGKNSQTNTTTTTTTKLQPKKKLATTIYHNVVQVKGENLIYLPNYFPVAFDALNLNGPISLIYNRVKPTKLQASLSLNRQTLDTIDGELSKSLPGSIVFEKSDFIGTNKSFNKLVTRLMRHFPNLSSKQLTELTIQSKYAIMKKHKHQYGFSGYKISDLVKYISDFICENSITSNNVPVSSNAEFRSHHSQYHPSGHIGGSGVKSLSSSAVAKGVSWSMVAALNNQQSSTNGNCQQSPQQQQQQPPQQQQSSTNIVPNLMKLEKSNPPINSGNLILSGNGRIIGELPAAMAVSMGNNNINSSLLSTSPVSSMNKLNLMSTSTSPLTTNFQHHHNSNITMQNNNGMLNINSVNNINNVSNNSNSSLTTILNSIGKNNSSLNISTNNNNNSTTSTICAFCKSAIVNGGGGGGSTGNNNNNLDNNNDNSKNQKIQIISCNHFFHKECLDYWTQKSNYCPQCEQYILRNDEFPSL